MLATVFPEHPWLPWRFNLPPKYYWDGVKNIKKFFDWAGKQLNVNEINDWYKVSRKVNFLEISLLMIEHQ
jgi:hypothetical protein